MTAEVPELAPWVPSLRQIGAYVLDYTIEAGVGQDVQTGTFTASTTPTQAEVESLRGDAVAWVQSSAGTLVGVGQVMGAAVAALRTAGMIVLTNPPGDVARAQLMLAQADEALERLVSVNEDAGGTPPPASGGGLVPQWDIHPYPTIRHRYYNGRPLL